MKKFLLVFLLVHSVMLTGCAEEKLLERVGVTTLIGYDKGKEEEIEITAIVRQVGTNLESEVTVISAENETIEGTRSRINYRTAEKLTSGQVRGVLFGDELAKEGIGHYLETMLRNSTISDGIFLTVVDGEAKPILEFNYPDILDIGEHIYKLLKQNIDNEQLVSSTLHEVSFDYYTVGRDITMPIINRDKELIAITGIALFNKGKMIGKLPVGDSFYVKLGRDPIHAGKAEIKIKGDDLPSSLLKDSTDEISIVIDPIKTRNKKKLVDKHHPEFDFHVSMQARIMEIKNDINVGDPKKVELLEEAISKALENEMVRIIAYTQEIGSDIYGFGGFYRSSVRQSNLTEEKWKEMYKNMEVNVDIDFTITRSGVFE
ncbi:Ger(x)C family spore germination protein [Sporosarcina sp. ITBMC105]